MSILQEILGWTQGLPTWQSDAVARWLAKPILSMDDQHDLFALLKVAHGIPDAKGRTEAVACNSCQLRGSFMYSIRSEIKYRELSIAFLDHFGGPACKASLAIAFMLALKSVVAGISKPSDNISANETTLPPFS
jgi:hypothetical protein